MADLSPSGLRVLLAVAETGSFTAAARTLSYTQSAISRQAASLEAAAGRQLFERHRGGARLTPAGGRLVTYARRIIDDLDEALVDVGGRSAGRVRLGAFPIALATVVPDALATVRHDHPELVVTVREGTTPSLVRAIRAGTLDLALVTQVPPYRPLDAESPALNTVTLAERELAVAMSASHPLAQRRAVEVDELAGQVWVASPGDGDSLLGVWPGLAERADVRVVARDWLAKLRFVASGAGITTIPPTLRDQLPDGVRIIGVRGEPTETRRLSVVHLPDSLAHHVAVVADALQHAAEDGR